MRVSIVLLTVLISLMLTACGDEDNGGADSGGETATTTQESAQKPGGEKPKEQREPKEKASEKPGPEVCLIRGGASDVEQRDETLWRGTLDSGGLLRVEKFGKAEAKEAVEAATDIDAAAAGPYAVFGTLKGQGSGEAVKTTADCLNNG